MHCAVQFLFRRESGRLSDRTDHIMGSYDGSAVGPGFDQLFRLVIIGDSGAGKSSLVHRFADGRFSDKFICTIGVDFRSKILQIDGDCINAQLWDTGGQERYRTITKAYYRGADGIVLVYDITNKKSFNNLTSWLEDIDINACDDVDVLLVGNKKDLAGRREVRYSKAKEFAQEAGMKFFETSAKGDICVESAFLSLIDLIRRRKSGEFIKLPDPEIIKEYIDLRQSATGSKCC